MTSTLRKGSRVYYRPGWHEDTTRLCVIRKRRGDLVHVAICDPQIRLICTRRHRHHAFFCFEGLSEFFVRITSIRAVRRAA